MNPVSENEKRSASKVQQSHVNAESNSFEEKTVSSGKGSANSFSNDSSSISQLKAVPYNLNNAPLQRKEVEGLSDLEVALQPATEIKQLKAVPYNFNNSPIQRKGEEEEESLQMKSKVIQRKGEEEEESLQMKSKVIQRKGEEEEESLQMKSKVIQRKGEEEEESLQMKSKVIQRKGEEEEESLQMKSKVIQRKGEEEEESLQMKSKILQRAESESKESKSASNNTGLPDQLKSGIENLSGQSMNDVNVHYNSSKPAQLQAHAYAQGTDIHLGSGQEKHLPHEAWHVVQQKQGRVKPTMQMKGKVNVNDDAGLEKEADVMGEKATKIDSVSSIGSGAIRNPTQLKSDDTHQLQIKMKDSGPAERTDKKEHVLIAEVDAVLLRNNIDEILSDIKKLEISLRSRVDDQRGRKKDTTEYDNHEHRIDVEEQQLSRLEDAKKVLRPPKVKKKKTKAKPGEWSTV